MKTNIITIFLCFASFIAPAPNVEASGLDWSLQVVVRPGAKICTLSPTVWGEKDHCHALTGDVAIESVDEPPNKEWIRVVTMDDTEEPPFYVKLRDLENYDAKGQSWAKK